MTYLYTNVFVALMQSHVAVRQAFRVRRSSDIVLSAIVLHELFFGAMGSRNRTAALQRLNTLAFTSFRLMRTTPGGPASFVRR